MREWLKKGASPDVKNLGTPLLLPYCRNGDVELVTLLLEYGADVGAVDRYGRSCLNAAAGSGNLQVIRMLLARGAYDEREKRRGMDGNVISKMVERGFVAEAMQLLEDYGGVNSDFWRPGLLISCITSGNVEYVKTALQAGADPNDASYSEYPIFFALRARKKDILEELIRSGAIIDAVNGFGETALTDAVKNNNIEMVETLVKCGANINREPKPGYSPFIAALSSFSRASSDMLMKLIELGADVNTSSKEGTPLHKACDRMSGGDEGLVKVLLEAGAKVNAVNSNKETPLQLAVKGGHYKVAEFLLRSGADPNMLDRSGKSALTEAITQFGGGGTFVKLLLEHGADPNLGQDFGKSPLACSIDRFGGVNIEVVELLLQHGADIEKATVHAGTPLAIAVERKAEDLCKVLLDHGANPNEGAKTGDSPIGKAVKSTPAIMRLLLDRGGSVSTERDNFKSTPLARAISAKQEENALLLIQHMADVNIYADTYDNRNSTHLGLAVRVDSESLCKALIDKGADVNARVSAEAPLDWPLTLAAHRGHASICRLLIDNGADISACDAKGFNALAKAMVQGHDAVIEILTEAGADVEAAKAKAQGKLLAEKLLDAVKAGNEDECRKLLNDGAKPDSIENKNPVMVAVENGHVNLLRILLEYIASNPEYSSLVNVPSTTRYRFGSKTFTPLLAAFNEQRLDMMELLLDHGANPDDEGMDVELNSLWTAYSKPDLPAFELLLRKGANPNVRLIGQDMMSVIMVERKQLDFLDLWLQHGGDVNAVSLQGGKKHGFSPLHMAAYKGLPQVSV